MKVTLKLILSCFIIIILFFLIKGNNLQIKLPLGLTKQRIENNNDLSKKIEVSIPLIILETKLGVGEGENGGPLPTRITIPENIKINLPEVYSSQLSAYAIAAYNTIEPIIIGPKDWTGKGTIGANGNTVVELHPINTSVNKEGPYISYDEIPACWACFHWQAGKYFPLVQKEAKGNPMLETSPIPNLKTIFLSPQIVAYSLPNTPDGLEVNGVAHMGILNNKPAQPFKKIEVALPKEQHELATVILNTFIERNIPK